MLTDTYGHLLTLTDTYRHLLTLTDTCWHFTKLTDTKNFILSFDSMNLSKVHTKFLRSRILTLYFRETCSRNILAKTTVSPTIQTNIITSEINSSWRSYHFIILDLYFTFSLYFAEDLVLFMINFAWFGYCLWF